MEEDVVAEIAELKARIAELQAGINDLNKRVLPRRTEAPGKVQVGRGSRIDPTVKFVVGSGESASIGGNANIKGGSEFVAPFTIGDGVFINNGAYVRKNVTLGDRVNIGPFVRLISDTHEIGPARRRAGKTVFPPINIEDGAWIGAGATVLGGVTVGRGSIVAAGAVVTRNVPEGALVAGVPARVIRQVDRAAPRLSIPRRAWRRIMRIVRA